MGASYGRQKSVLTVYISSKINASRYGVYPIKILPRRRFSGKFFVKNRDGLALAQSSKLDADSACF